MIISKRTRTFRYRLSRLRCLTLQMKNKLQKPAVMIDARSSRHVCQARKTPSLQQGLVKAMLERALHWTDIEKGLKLKLAALRKDTNASVCRLNSFLLWCSFVCLLFVCASVFFFLIRLFLVRASYNTQRHQCISHSLMTITDNVTLFSGDG